MRDDDLQLRPMLEREVGRVKADHKEAVAYAARLAEQLDDLKALLAHYPDATAAKDPTFGISLGKTSRSRGHFNMPASHDKLLGDGHEVTILLPHGSVRAFMNRTANGNGTARIGSAALRRWFETLGPHTKIRCTVEGEDRVRMETT